MILAQTAAHCVKRRRRREERSTIPSSKKEAPTIVTLSGDLEKFTVQFDDYTNDCAVKDFDCSPSNLNRQYHQQPSWGLVGGRAVLMVSSLSTDGRGSVWCHQFPVGDPSACAARPPACSSAVAGSINRSADNRQSITVGPSGVDISLSPYIHTAAESESATLISVSCALRCNGGPVDVSEGSSLLTSATVVTHCCWTSQAGPRRRASLTVARSADVQYRETRKKS